MAYRLEGTEIVIDGWEKGISDDPYSGINDMRGVNIISIPGEAPVSFAQTSVTLPTVTATITSAVAATDIVTATINTGSLVTGQAVTFTGGSLPTGLVAGTIYWITRLSNTTFTVYSDCRLTTLVNITATGTGTMASIDMGEIKYFEKVVGVALDANGRAWDNTQGLGYYIFLGNDVTSTVGLTNRNGNGLVWYKGYLFLFYNSRICYTVYPQSGYSTVTWVNEWSPTTGAPAVGTAVFNTPTGTTNSHDALVGQDNVIYIADASYVASLFEKAGSTFDPTNTATYTWAQQALKIPSIDTATCLEELGINLMVGGIYNYVYPWDRVSTSFKYPIKIADNGTKRMLTVNTNTYIFAGRRGRIYKTNGSQADFYKKIPDHISGIDPIFDWTNCAYNKNQLYFGVSAKNNAQTDITTYAGLWAIDITTDALRVATLQSTTTATVSAIFAYYSVSSGFGLAVGWKTASTYGIDTANSSPYTSYIPYIESDLIPVGQYLKKKTFENIEFKLSVPLVSGEGIKISARKHKSDTYVQVGETTAVGALSDFYIVNFDQSQWLQLKIETKSTASSPSYVRLKEIRIR